MNLFQDGQIALLARIHPYRLAGIFTASLTPLKMHMAASLICLQTRHIWMLPDAGVSKTGLMPHNVAEVQTGQKTHVPSHCLFFQCCSLLTNVNKTL